MHQSVFEALIARHAPPLGGAINHAGTWRQSDFLIEQIVVVRRSPDATYSKQSLFGKDVLQTGLGRAAPKSTDQRPAVSRNEFAYDGEGYG
jgi:hypothetical protein